MLDKNVFRILSGIFIASFRKVSSLVTKGLQNACQFTFDKQSRIWFWIPVETKHILFSVRVASVLVF